MSHNEPKTTNFAESLDNIPAIDDDEQIVVEDEHANISNGMGSKSMDSINSYDGSRSGLDDSQDQGDDVEKARLISQVLELQNTLDDLNQRVDGVKEENLRLKSENMVLGQYIENLMSASSVFSSTSPNNLNKKK